MTAEWVPLAFAAPDSRAESENPGVWETSGGTGTTSSWSAR
jgi:hypothetical protein